MLSTLLARARRFVRRNRVVLMAVVVALWPVYEAGGLTWKAAVPIVVGVLIRQTHTPANGADLAQALEGLTPRQQARALRIDRDQGRPHPPLTAEEAARARRAA